MKTLKLILMYMVLGLGMMSLSGASALALVSSDQQPSTRAVTPRSDGLVAYWNFDKGSGTLLDDSSGNGHTGAINGATWVPGKIGSALSFDGRNDYVQVPNAPDLSDWDQYTFEAWVYLRGLSQNNWQFVLEKPGNDGCQNGESYGFVWRQVGWRTPWDPDRITSTFNNDDDQGFGIMYAHEDEGPLKPSLLDYAWHHFAATYDGDVLLGYVDGIQVDATPGTGAVRATTSPLYIGAGLGWCYMAAHFKGDIDELKIYSRALTADEIAQDAGVAEPKADLALVKTFSAPATQDMSYRFVLLVNNLGPDRAKDIVVSDTLPDGVELVKAVGGQAQCATVAQVVTCTLGRLDANATANIRLRVRIPGQHRTLKNCANVQAETPDPDASNNEACIEIQPLSR